MNMLSRDGIEYDGIRTLTGGDDNIKESEETI